MNRLKQFVFLPIYLLIAFNYLLSCNKRQSSNINGNDFDLTNDSIQIRNYLTKAFSQNLYSKEREIYIDSALAINNKIARLWQQKAMPYYKARKYQLGKPFLEKAVRLDERRYLDYSAFMKCIFSKEYKESIAEFSLMKKKYGDSYVMDHTYNFYIALCYLQINNFKKAKKFLEMSREQQFRDFPNDPPEEACHYLDWFYLGISEYELGNNLSAIDCFDISLSIYTNFAEALYYKGLCLKNLGCKNSSDYLMRLAEQNRKNTINEDNVIYEIYPYQIYHLIQR